MRETTRLRSATLALLLTSALSVLGFVVTLDRAPRVWPDEVLYASIARSIQLGGPGVPSILNQPSVAVDHEVFYGPVFFRLAVASFNMFGFSSASFRFVGFVGVLLMGIAAIGLVRITGGSRVQQLWAFTLLMLTPEIGAAATNGRMDALAVGLSLAGLALFLSALEDGTRAVPRAAAAGIFLAFAALTTPRTYPFVAAFVLTGCGLSVRRPAGDRLAPALLASALLPLLLIFGTWATVAIGSPAAWLRYLLSIAASTPIDAGIAPDGTRNWEVLPWTVLTPACALITALIAGRSLWRARAQQDADPSGSRAFLFGMMVTNAGLYLVALNYTFAFGIYFAVPALAVVLALPDSPLALARLRSVRAHPGAALVCVSFLAACLGIRIVKYAGAAAAWSARDPEPLRSFIARNVPSGSEVSGPRDFGLYAVEGAGLAYRSLRQESWADWARTVPVIPHDGGTSHGHARSARFLLWPLDRALPAPPPCLLRALKAPSAVFEPPPHHLDALGPLAPLVGTTGYPRTALYRVPANCL